MDNDEYSIDISTIGGQTWTYTVPSTPKIGDIYLDTNSMDVNVYGNNGEWLTINDSGDLDWTSMSQEVLFENTMPNPVELTEMCKEYPSLEKAYENFKSIYKMVEQDWRGKQKERGDPPF